jgi:ribosome-associated protein
MALHTFPLDGEFIELNVLLKLLALAPSGGAAKAMIAAGLVSVDGEVETRKARKLNVGQVVRLGNEEIRIVAATENGQFNSRKT